MDVCGRIQGWVFRSFWIGFLHYSGSVLKQNYVATGLRVEGWGFRGLSGSEVGLLCGELHV